MAVDILAEAYELKSNQIFNGSFGGTHYVYRIPKFQRPYVWGKDNWGDLFNDITDNDAGYFVGALLCVQIKQGNADYYGEYEVVDGQQRLTTMSLFLAAIYKVITDYGVDKLNKKQKSLFEQIPVQLTVEDVAGKSFLRVFPQKDEENRDDYLYIMGGGNEDNDFLNLINLDEIVGVGKLAPTRIGNRRLCKAYRFFKNEVLKYARDRNEKDVNEQLAAVFEILMKVNAATFVRILAPSRAGANKLFEALNNRGVPLTITDLIKNQLLSKVNDVSAANQKWREATKIFSRNNKEIPAGEQERFFRQSYNAYRFFWKDYINPVVAKRANLYDQYEKMIDSRPNGAEKLLDQLLEASRFYKQIQGDAPGNVPSTLQNLYVDLRYINNTTSYGLLIFLLKNRVELEITDDKLAKILRLLIAFFVRHSFTNNPPFNALERIFNSFIEEVDVGVRNPKTNELSAGPYKGGEIIYQKLRDRLKKEYLSAGGGIKTFEPALRGDIYAGNGKDDNIRFVLVKLAENHLAKKSQIDFWEKKDDSSRLLWSIEHVLPQTLPDNSPWIAELGCSNLKDAQDVQEKYVHKLGNLTLTNYNSELSNKSFVEKRDAKDKDGNSIGYKGLLSLDGGLNSYIATQETWTPTQIDERTELLIKEILEIFAW